MYNLPVGPKNRTSLNVRSLLITNTGGYEAQVIRPYQTRVDESTLSLIGAHLDRYGKVDAGFISTNTPGFIERSADNLGVLPITSGWEEKRCRFFLEVVINDGFGGKEQITYVQGFTDHLGITNTSIDPDMVFYVNSYTSGELLPQSNTPYGLSGGGFRMSENTHVLGGNGSRENDRLFLANPVEVIATMNLDSVMHELKSNGADLRTNVNAVETKRSSRTHDSGSEFISEIANAFAVQSTGIHEPNSSYLNNVMNYLDQDLRNTNRFMLAISANRPGYIGGTSFTFRELCELDPGTVNVLKISVSNNVYYPGQMSHMLGNDRITQVVSSIMSSVPALMTALFITKLAFTSTNSDIGGLVNTAIIDANSPNGSVTPLSLEAFKKRMELEIIRNFTFNNQISYELIMQVDILGETKISLSLDGSPRYDYCVPTFADSLLSPVVTNDVNTVSKLALAVDGFRELLGNGFLPNNTHSVVLHEPNNGLSTSWNNNSAPLQFY